MRSQKYAALEEGLVIASRYELLAFQEETPIGKTYLAKDRREETHCILKVLRPDLTNNPEIQGRFAQQLEEFCQASKHKSLVTYYDYATDTTSGLMYFTMEHIDGETLEDLLKQSDEVPPLPLRHSLRILQRVARSLTHIHNRGFVHRDIKPDNIMMMPDGDCKLMDFGLITNISSTQPKLYTSILDTGEEPIPRAADLQSASSDIYALGALTYRLLTGKYPYPDDILPPSVYHDTFPYTLNSIVLQALETLPEDRPSSAVLYIKEVTEAIQPLLPKPLPGEELPPLSEPPSYDSHRSYPSARTGSKPGIKEFFVQMYSKFFRYSLTKQARQQRRRRIRFFSFLFLLSLLLGTAAWWFWN